MNRLHALLLAAVAVFLLWAAPASAQVGVRYNTTRQAAITSYYAPYSINGGYTRFLNYGPYTGQGFSSIQPLSPGYNGLPLMAQPVYVDPDPYYYNYYYAPPVYYNSPRRSNWGLDNMRPVGTLRR